MQLNKQRSIKKKDHELALKLKCAGYQQYEKKCKSQNDFLQGASIFIARDKTWWGTQNTSLEPPDSKRAEDPGNNNNNNMTISTMVP